MAAIEMQDLNKVETESFIQRNNQVRRKRFLWKIVCEKLGVGILVGIIGIILLSVSAKYGSTYGSTNQTTDNLLNAVNASIPNEETMAAATSILNLTTQGSTIEDQTPNFNFDNNMGSTTTTASIEPDSGAKHIVGNAEASKEYNTLTTKENKKPTTTPLPTEDDENTSFESPQRLPVDVPIQTHTSDTTPKEGKKILETSSFEDVSKDIFDEILRYS